MTGHPSARAIPPSAPRSSRVRRSAPRVRCPSRPRAAAARASSPSVTFPREITPTSRRTQRPATGGGRHRPFPGQLVNGPHENAPVRPPGKHHVDLVVPTRVNGVSRSTATRAGHPVGRSPRVSKNSFQNDASLLGSDGRVRCKHAGSPERFFCGVAPRGSSLSRTCHERRRVVSMSVTTLFASGHVGYPLVPRSRDR